MDNILANKTVLVIGAGGFIGSHIVEALLQEKARVVAFDKKSFAESSLPKHLLNDPNFIYRQGNTVNLAEVHLVFAEFKPEYVCHQAAEVSVPESIKEMDKYFRVNVIGTNNVFDTAAYFGVKTVVYASSCAIYECTSPYAYNKVMNEEQAAMYQQFSKTKFIGLRYFNVYGPRQIIGTEGAVVPTFIREMRKGQPIIHGDGTQTRDFIFVRDVAKANVQALKYSGITPIFEIGTGDSTSINYLYDCLCVAMGGGPEPKYSPEREGDIKYSRAINQLDAQLELDWKPMFSMTKGLSITCFAYGKDYDE